MLSLEADISNCKIIHVLGSNGVAQFGQPEEFYISATALSSNNIFFCICSIGGTEFYCTFKFNNSKISISTITPTSYNGYMFYFFGIK